MVDRESNPGSRPRREKTPPRGWRPRRVALSWGRFFWLTGTIAGLPRLGFAAAQHPVVEYNDKEPLQRPQPILIVLGPFLLDNEQNGTADTGEL